MFEEVSGYHTLQHEFDWMKKNVESQESEFKHASSSWFTFASNIFGPLVPWATKVQMLSAVIQGVQSHKTQYVDALNGLALLSALLLPFALELISNANETIWDPFSDRFCVFSEEDLAKEDRDDTNARPNLCWYNTIATTISQQFQSASHLLLFFPRLLRAYGT